MFKLLHKSFLYSTKTGTILAMIENNKNILRVYDHSTTKAQMLESILSPF